MTWAGMNMAGSGIDAGFPLGSRIAGYRLENQIGRGGMAVVFRAFDEVLNRQVAVKILAPALADDEAFRQRFIRESRSAAMVDDPHIIPVFAAGEANGALYIAMRYVPSGDVGSLVRREGPLPPARATVIVSAVAAALDAAHGAGLVHRDVKPANMLVDLRPSRPDHIYLSDFGLAKSAAAATSLTGTNHFLGTLDYCAPEQIEGKPVGARADQYALACSAFMILAGEPPFTRDDSRAVMHAQLIDPPARLADRVPGVPAAVDEVLARALAKAPGDRYLSCGEFAGALRAAFGLASPDGVHDGYQGHPATEVARGSGGRAVAGEHGDEAFRETADAVAPHGATQVPDPSVPAYHAPHAAGPAWKPGRPSGLAVAAIVGAAILAAGGGVAAAIVVSDGGQRPSALGSGLAAGSAGASPAATPSAPGTTTPQNPGLTSPPNPGSAGANPGAVSATVIRSLTDPGGGSRHVNSVAVSPDGTMLVTGDSNGDAFLWSAQTGRLISTLHPGAGTKIFAVAVSANSAVAATGAGNGRTYLWSTGTGQLVGTITDPGGKEVDSVAFSPSGTRLATGDGSGGIFLWNVSADGRSATLARTLPDPLGAGVWALAFSPDGASLAAGDYQDTTCLWNLGSSASPTLLTGPGGQQDATAVAFSPDGSTLASGYTDGKVYLWNVSSQTHTVISEPATVWGVAFSKSGLLAIGDGDGSTYLVDPASGQASNTLADPASGSQGVGAVAFSPNGKTLVAGDTDGTTYLWRIGG
jgi:tRNA A-37 threonylcarbamoyl transferase component Bud32